MKTANDNTLTDAYRIKARRSRVLELVQQAQSLLIQAHQLASPLEGWAAGGEEEGEPRGPYNLLSDHYDATKALWHTISNFPEPTGYWKG